MIAGEPNESLEFAILTSTASEGTECLVFSGKGLSDAETLVARDVLDSASVIVDVVDMFSDMVKFDTDSAGSYCTVSGPAGSSECAGTLSSMAS